MALRYRTKALVVKKTDRGEADQVITFYTKEFGKLQILGKAIRKIKSKLRSSSELFCYSDIEFIQGKVFKTLTDASVQDSFQHLRDNLEKMRAAFRMADLLNGLIKGEEKDKAVWKLLLESFKRLDSSSASGFLVYHYFAWNLFSLSGYQIDLQRCFSCQKKLEEGEVVFSQEEGFACSSCLKGVETSAEVIKILRLFLERDWETLTKIKIPDSEKEELVSFTESFASSI